MTAKTRPEPSSGDTGFFQPSPVLANQFDDDIAFQRIVKLFLPDESYEVARKCLSGFADMCVHPDVLAMTGDAERNPPGLSTHSPFGHPETTLTTSEGRRKLSEIQVRNGIVAMGFSHSPVRAGTFGSTSTIKQLVEMERRAEPDQSRPAQVDELERSLPAAFARLHQFFKYHLWTGSSAVVTCPAAMTDGAAKLLERHILSPHTPDDHRDVFLHAFFRLTSRTAGFAWSSGQWMTERPGGSDVSRTETRAQFEPFKHGRSDAPADQKKARFDSDGLPLGDWTVDGFKWFSSATDGDAAILLAKTDHDGLTAFFAPTRRIPAGQTIPRPSTGPPAGAIPLLRTRPGTQLNGIRIQRLKPKLGTRAVPTAELILRDMRAYPVGQIGRGVREIATVLNITRIHNAVSAVGMLGRGLGIARAYSRVRRIRDRDKPATILLESVPAHVRTMAAVHVAYRADLFLAFVAVALLGTVETDGYAAVAGWSSAQTGRSQLTGETRPAGLLLPKSTAERSGLLRLLTPVAKIVTAKTAIAGLSECCEMLGGIGYLEYPDQVTFNVARLLRDAQVLSIWEGTSDVLADDLVRVITGPAGNDVRRTFISWVQSNMAPLKKEWQDCITTKLALFDSLTSSLSTDELVYRSRETVGMVGWIVAGMLLAIDAATASRQPNPDQVQVAVLSEIASRWINQQPWPSATSVHPSQRTSSANAEMDRLIVFGRKAGSPKQQASL